MGKVIDPGRKIWHALRACALAACGAVLPAQPWPKDRGEQAAARYGRRLGWELLDANLRIGYDEGDLLFLDEASRLILVEVKSTAGDEDPVWALDRAKEACLRRLALAIAGEAARGRWTRAHRQRQGRRTAAPIEVPRIDLVTVQLAREGPRGDHVLRHYRQAVEEGRVPRRRGVLRP